MTPRRLALGAIAFVLVLLVGGVGLRLALLGVSAGDLPGLSWVPGVRSLIFTSTPITSARYVELSATPMTGTPMPTLTTTPVDPLLPLIEQTATARLTPSSTVTPVTPSTTPSPSLTPAPTNTPIPTPTRAPMRATKLGVGIYESGGSMLPDLDQTRPSVILLMDPADDFAREVRRMFPKAFIVGRIFSKDQPLDNPEARGTAFADRVAQKAVPLKGVVDAWMSYNEITGHKDYENYKAYNRFQVAFAKRLQGNYGIPAVAANDATGTVEPVDYVKYFAEAIRESKYFGVHSYAPKGVNSMRDPRGYYLVLRHREIKAALDAAGVKSGPFIITESGLWDGFRGAATEESMADDYIWYGEELNKDPYVLGTTLFGVFRNAEEWRAFNIAGTQIAARIGQYNSQSWGR